MNNAFAKYSPGTLLAYYLMKYIQERGFIGLNVGEGGGDHKNSLGGAPSTLVGVSVRRGAVSLLSNMADSRPLRRLDSVLGVRSWLFQGIRR